MHGVTVLVTFPVHAVKVRVAVGNGMSVCHAVVGVRERVSVGMGVFRLQRVQNHQNGTQQHYRQCQKILYCQGIVPDNTGKGRADKGGDGIVGTGLGGSEGVLGTDVAENTQPVGNKSQKQCRSSSVQSGERLSDAQSNEKRTQSGKDALEKDDLESTFVGNIALCHLPQPPAGSRRQHQQGASGKVQAGHILERQNAAGQSD